MHLRAAECAGSAAVPKSSGFGTSVPRGAADIDFEETAALIPPEKVKCMQGMQVPQGDF
jgi:hypothetical protein